MKCRRCGCEANKIERTPNGPHYAKLVCAVCGTFLNWMPRPVYPVNMAKVPKFDPSTALPLLVAKSDSQTALASNCRRDMLARLEGELDANLFAAMRLINDPTWWIGNAKKAPSAIHWPKEWVDEPQEA